MNERERGFERLRNANPAPVVLLEDRPTAHEMLVLIRQGPEFEVSSPARVRRNVLAAAAGIAVVVMIAILTVPFLSSRDENPPIAPEPPVTTTLSDTATTTTAPPVTTTLSQAATTTVPLVIDESTQALLDTFVSRYNADDVDAFMAFLHPDFEREIDREGASLATIRIWQEIEVVLGTEIALECERTEFSIKCTPTKTDDLHLIVGHEPTVGVPWYLTFENGLLRSWSEQRSLAATDYEANMAFPFDRWVEANRPEFRVLVEFVGAGWVPRDGIAEDIASLVPEWASSLGVELR